MLVVVRHGRTEANATGLLLGRHDPPLDDTGRAQAVALAAAVGEADRVVTSPLLRARETAAAFGRDVEVDDRWIELDYGAWDGRPISGVGAEEWARWRSDVHFRPPGGETLAELGARVRQACDDLADVARSGTVVVVSHVSPIKAAVTWAMGVGDEAVWHLYVAPASITRVEVRDGRPVLISFDEVSHLD